MSSLFFYKATEVVGASDRSCIPMYGMGNMSSQVASFTLGALQIPEIPGNSARS